MYTLYTHTGVFSLWKGLRVCVCLCLIWSLLLYHFMIPVIQRDVKLLPQILFLAVLSVSRCPWLNQFVTGLGLICSEWD